MHRCSPTPTHFEKSRSCSNYSSKRQFLFGLQPHPRVTPRQAEWWLREIQEIDPDAMAPGPYVLAAMAYEQLLVLAAGIQAAGPNLNAETFGSALMALQYSATKPEPPHWVPTVGFGANDHSFYNDYALVWSSNVAYPDQPSTTLRRGWCYLDRGARYSAGNVPADADARFFSPDEPCR